VATAYLRQQVVWGATHLALR